MHLIYAEKWRMNAFILSFNVFKGEKKKGGVEQEEIFEDFLARSKFEQDFSCRKSTTLTSFDISRKNANFCTGAAVLVSCFT